MAGDGGPVEVGVVDALGNDLGSGRGLGHRVCNGLIAGVLARHARLIVVLGSVGGRHGCSQHQGQETGQSVLHRDLQGAV